MPLVFDVDGKTVENPSAEDIATGFASIDDEGPRSISIIELQRPPFTLCAFGNPKEGYTLDLREEVEPKGTVISKVTSPGKMIPHEEVVALFQSFLRKEDSWQSRYEWEPGLNEMPAGRVVKRLVVLIVLLLVVLAVLKYVLKRF
jgi:hypothetical protein